MKNKKLISVYFMFLFLTGCTTDSTIFWNGKDIIALGIIVLIIVIIAILLLIGKIISIFRKK